MCIQETSRSIHHLIQLKGELVKIAKGVKEVRDKGQKMNLTEDEVASYDALAENESAVQVLGDESLRKTAKLLVQQVEQTPR